MKRTQQQFPLSAIISNTLSSEANPAGEPYNLYCKTTIIILGALKRKVGHVAQPVWGLG